MQGDTRSVSGLLAYLFIYLFIYSFIHIEREREAETQAEGEAGSMHLKPDVGLNPRTSGS